MDLEHNSAFDQRIDREFRRRVAALARDREKPDRPISSVPHPYIIIDSVIPPMSGIHTTSGFAAAVTSQSVSACVILPTSSVMLSTSTVILPTSSAVAWTTITNETVNACATLPTSMTPIATSVVGTTAVANQSVTAWANLATSIAPTWATSVVPTRAVPNQPVHDFILALPGTGKTATAIAAMSGILDRTSLQIVSRVVFQLIQNDQVALARKLLNSLPVGYSNPTIERIRKVIAPPTTKVNSTRDVDRQRDYLWIKEHAEEYRGQWVALDQGRLIAKAPSLRDLLARIKQLRLSNRPLLHCIT
jgi:Family of unknown function (DUF5678)